MKRVAVFCLIAVALALAPAAVNAQGFFGAGLPGLPSFGGYLGGPAGCGEKVCPSSNLEVYVGWMEDRDGTSIDVDTDGTGVGGVTSIRHHFTNRGLWLGLSDAVCLSDRLSFIGSGWYLVPSNSTSFEQYNENVASRTWDTDARWWYVDGLVAFGTGGLNVLAGLRYDYYTIRFKNPFDVAGILSLPTDTADATSEGWIPLFGLQYAQSSSTGNLVFRAVGVPTLLGNIRYKQTFGGTDRGDVRGNYSSGYFLEFFAEYSKTFGPGSVGVFGRWNTTQGNSNVDFNLAGTVAPGDQRFKLTVHRNSWTVGASFSLNFTLPYM
jgi:hypothetical protein